MLEELVLKIFRMSEPRPFLCSFCNRPVDLESARTDEDGQAIHAECYLAKMQGKQALEASEVTE